MTDENKIRQLLEAFYNSDTTVEEETLLLNFFNDKNLNEQWHTKRDLFNVLYGSSDIKLPQELSKRLENVIDNFIDDTSHKSLIKIDHHIERSSYKNISSQTKIRKLIVSIGSVAAIALLCIGLFFVSNKPASTQTMVVDTFTNPEEAAIVAERALMLVSSKLNKGLYSLEKAKDGIDKSNELLNENLSLN